MLKLTPSAPPKSCNSCNTKRIKCSGEKPCRQCSQASRECAYPAPVTHVKVTEAELQRWRGIEKLLQDHNIPIPPELQPNRANIVSSPELAVGSPSSSTYYEAFTFNFGGGGGGSSFERHGGSHTNEGRILLDTDGARRYVGGTSGATFLDELKGFIKVTEPLCPNRADPQGTTGAAFLESEGRYKSSDSVPMALPKIDDMYAMPPPESTKELLDELSVFLQDGNNLYPSGGIYFWPQSSSSSPTPTPAPNSVQGPSNHVLLAKKRDLALMNAKLAFASLLKLTDPNSRVDGALGEEYYARAKLLLGDMFETVSRTTKDIPALALMAMYLIENNRRDTAYMVIGNAMDICITFGLHIESHSEVYRRTFWTLYILDRSVGRPLFRHDCLLTSPSQMAELPDGPTA